MKKIIEILKLFETTRNNISKNLKIHFVIKIIATILKQKFFEFFYKFKNVFNFKKIENLLFHRIYNYKIEFINNDFAFFKNKIYFYYLKNLKHCKNILKNILKRNSLISTMFFLFRLFFSSLNQTNNYNYTLIIENLTLLSNATYI